MGERDAVALARLAVPEAARPPVQTWLDLLREWNKRMDLTAARNDDELFDLMLADALVLSAHLAQNARVVDIGCGAGAPGLALALVRPDLAVTLVEPLAKRVAFLRTVLGTLGRTDIVLAKEKGEATAARSAGGAGAGWDVAISRATLAPSEWIPLGLRLAPVAWVLLAKEEPPDVAGMKRAPKRVRDVTYEWPLTGASRRAVEYER
jgi:16S rRNA (guanine527-N7)-methyltransferase